MKTEPIGSPEASILNQLTPRNNTEDGRIQFNCGSNPAISQSFSISLPVFPNLLAAYTSYFSRLERLKNDAADDGVGSNNEVYFRL